MNIHEISKPVTSASLNESLAKKFGQKINIAKFTLEQLQDARNRIRTKLSQVETNESFDSVHTNESYQKSKLFLDVLNAAISEQSDVQEGSKPDFLDVDKDGDKKEPMKKAIKDKKKGNKPKKGVNPFKKKKTDEGKDIIGNYFTNLLEGAEDHAELVMASKDMVDRLTGWMEDTAEMQSESMLELADAIRDEMGSEKSEAFTAAVKPSLEALYTAMEQTRVALTGGVGQLTGEGGEAPMMGDEPAMEPTIDGDMADPMDPDAPMDEPVDDFAAADAAMGGEAEAGREKRESVVRSKKKLAEKSNKARRLTTILSKKK
tara:strand:- start:1307 stop:2260 length:954 start_codon:yes stop_codon:yes gene_type:complete